MRYFIALLILVSCTDHHFSNRDEHTALLRACSACKRSGSEMAWFASVLQQADTDPAQQGNIYLAKINDQVLFIHQPAVMSCLACVVYDCQGNRIETDPALIVQIIPFLTDEHRMFSSYP